MTAEVTITRTYGALAGLTIGSALGAPLQGMSRSLIQELYGLPIEGFEDPSHDHEVAAGRMHAGPAAGTSCTEALAVARHLADHSGELDLGQLAPSFAEVPGAVPGHSITNAAAVRCLPAGMVVPAGELARLVEMVAQLASPTHGSHVAIAAAAASAAAVSAGISTGSLDAAIAAAVQAARLAPQYGRYMAAPHFAQRLDWALACVEPGDPEASFALIGDLVGTSRAAQESVPAAFALLASLGPQCEPWLACRWAASLGGSASEIAAITGAISGACHGFGAINPDAMAAITAANPGLDLGELAGALAKLRG